VVEALPLGLILLPHPLLVDVVDRYHQSPHIPHCIQGLSPVAGTEELEHFFIELFFFIANIEEESEGVEEGHELLFIEQVGVVSADLVDLANVLDSHTELPEEPLRKDLERAL